MTVANTRAQSQSSQNTSRSDNRTSSGPRDKMRSSDVKHHDQLSFLEGIRGFEAPNAVFGNSFEGFVGARNSSRESGGGAQHAHGSAQASFNAPAAEDASAAMLSNTIIQKMLRDPSLKNMAFTVQNKHGSVNVEASINNGAMRCLLSSKSERLRRRMLNAREQIINRVGGHLRMPIELDIEE